MGWMKKITQTVERRHPNKAIEAQFTRTYILTHITRLSQAHEDH